MVAITGNGYRAGNPESGNPKEKWPLKTKIIASVGGVAVVASAAFGISKVGSHEKSIPMDNDGGDRVASAPVVPGEAEGQAAAEEKLSLNAFLSLGNEERLSSLDNTFQSDTEREEAFQRMLPWLTDDQKKVAESGVPTGDPALYTPEQISLDNYIRAQAVTTVDDEKTANMTQAERDIIINEHIKAYSTVLSPEHPDFKENSSKIGFDKGALLGLSAVTGSYPMINTGEIPYSDGSGKMHDLNGKPSIIMFTEYLKNRSDVSGDEKKKNGIPLYQLVKTDNSGAEWLLVDTYSMNDIDMINNFVAAHSN